MNTQGRFQVLVSLKGHSPCVLSVKLLIPLGLRLLHHPVVYVFPAFFGVFSKGQLLQVSLIELLAGFLKSLIKTCFLISCAWQLAPILCPSPVLKHFSFCSFVPCLWTLVVVSRVAAPSNIHVESRKPLRPKPNGPGPQGAAGTGATPAPQPSHPDTSGGPSGPLVSLTAAASSLWPSLRLRLSSRLQEATGGPQGLGCLFHFNNETRRPEPTRG